MNLHEEEFNFYYGMNAWGNSNFTLQRTAWLRALNEAAKEHAKPTEAQAKVFYDFVVMASGEELHHGVALSFDDLWRRLIEAKHES